MISKFFIEHPVLANVLAIVLVLLGAVSLFRLPVSEYPNVVPPTVSVTASYPGASAADRHRHDRPADRAAGQRRRSHALHGIDQRVRRHLQPDGDLRDRHRPGYRPGPGAEPRAARAGLAAANRSQAQGVSVQKKNTAILQIVTLDSPDGQYDSLFMSNYATINLTNVLARLPGVGSVKVFGAGTYSMRVWMDPQKLYSFGLEPKDVIERDPPAEPERGGRAGWHAAGAERHGIPVHGRYPVTAERSKPVRRHRRQGSDRPGRPPDLSSATSRASSSARRPMRRTSS